MKIDNVKKIKDKTNIRAVDISESDMTPYQRAAEDTVPNYALVNALINPFFNHEKIKETCANVVDLLKGTRNIVSLQYNAETVLKVLAINYALVVYVSIMDAALQMTKLVAYNDSAVMRYLLSNKFSLSNATIDNLLNNREEYTAQIAAAKAKIKSRMLKLGHFEEMLEQFIYDFRFDDQAQYTTKIGYSCDFVLYNDGAGGMVTNALTKLFGTASINIIGCGGKSTDPQKVAYETLITTPAQWFSRVDECCESLFANTEYHAFRTEYMNLYLKDSLWDLQTYKVKSYYNDSDMAVLANASPAPLLCVLVTAWPATEQWDTYPTASAMQSITDNTITSVINSDKTATMLLSVGIDSTYSGAWMPQQNNGFEEAHIFRDTAINKGVDHSNKMLNIHKASCAKDAEFSAICAHSPSNIIAWNDSNTAKFLVRVGAVTIIDYTYIWSNHYKNGAIAFTNSARTYSAPFAYRVYQTNSSPTEIRRVTAASEMVNGLPPLFRVFYDANNSKHVVDAIQEQYDLYELTPASIYLAQRAMQFTWINTKLKVADNIKAENFADLLDNLS